MVSAGWIYLAAMIGVYGFGNLFQSIAANRVKLHRTLHPGLLMRLVTHKTYILGVVLQFTGFLLAFLARRDLPLFLVQASAAAGVGMTAILGVLLLRWRLPWAEVVMLVLMAAGLAGQMLAAQPGVARPLGTFGLVALSAALPAIAALALAAVRLHGAPGSVALGSLAGLAFGAAAIASRPLAAVNSAPELFASPLLYLLIVHSVLAQLLVGLAMQRGSTTASVAAMDVTAAVPAALVGLLVLGDRFRPGLGWLGWLGFALAVLAVLGLARYAKSQPRSATVPRPRVEPARRTVPAARTDHPQPVGAGRAVPRELARDSA